MVLSILLLCLQVVLCYELHIKNTSDFIAFSKNVSSGTGYKQTTVFLDNDIDFSGLFEQSEPIGKDGSGEFFQGSFDGQGHTISSLAINSSSQYAGLFGHVFVAKIKNVVLDSSCSVTSYYNGSSHAYAGGIAGYCGSCTIENSVNMASVSFSGSITGYLYLGGIAGYLSSSENFVRSCANYGSVIQTGSVGSIGENGGIAYIGGIAGISYKGNVSIQNSLNYGEVIHNGRAVLNSCVGGILGYVEGETNYIENCVSAGKITLANETPADGYIGSIVGRVNAGKLNITHCYWTSDVGYYEAYGGKHSSLATVNVGNETSLVSLNKTSMNSLNNYASSGSWSKWFMLHLNGGKVNSTNQETLIVTQKHFPKPEKEDNTFLFWCLDVDCTEQYDPSTTADMTKVTDLYAQWEKSTYTLTFNYGNGTVVSETLNYNETINYPDNLTREGYTFNGWNPKPDRMPANDTTVVAQWNETETELVEITFDTKGMTKKDIEDLVKKLTDSDFEIVGFDEDKDTGETKVIIEFKDAIAAKNFVDSIRGSSESLNIRYIGYLKEKPHSAATKMRACFFTTLFLIAFLSN